MAISDHLLAVIRTLSEATLLTSGAGQVFAANRPARDALGIELEQPEGCQLSDLFEEPERLASYMRSCARSTEPLPGGFSVRRRSPLTDAVSYSCKGSVIVPRAGMSPSIVLLRLWPRSVETPFVLLNQHIAELNREIDRRRHVEEALRHNEISIRQRAIEAEALNRSKDEFLATLSHELRTPLNAILGWATILKQGKLSHEREQRALETIERNARAQAQLIDELLDSSRIITGKLRLNIQQVDPMYIVEAAIDGVRPAAEAKDIQIELTLDPHAGPLLGDPDRLQQVCWNLLSNAVKFTAKGGCIQVLLQRVDASLELAVTDTGKGIHSDFLPYVFDRFRQQDASITRHFGGLGLGLSIVKSLIELHGGAVRVESAGEGQGATFIVRLPRALQRVSPVVRPFTPPLGATPEKAEVPAAMAGLRLVIVDDDGDALDLLAALLERAGAKVKAVQSPSDAFDAIQIVRPDVIISDIGMPGEDGYSLIRRVRSLSTSAGGSTPAIALTALARGEDRTQALQAGFHAYVPKPAKPDELLAVIASLVKPLSAEPLPIGRTKPWPVFNQPIL